MKNNIKAKIISASAGTGKTFRLSIEYIETLLKQPEPRNPEFYKEIVVLTFTKKATAEIAERIVSHLKNIIEDPNGKGYDIIAQLGKLRQADFDFLKQIYLNIISNKHNFRIQTIDSFFGTLFQSIVTPAFHIDDYEIVHEQKPEIYALLLEQIINEDSFHFLVKKYLHKGKEITMYESLIKGLLANRWIIENTDTDIFGDTDHLKGFVKEALKTYRNNFIKQLQLIIESENVKLQDVFMSTFPFKSVLEHNGINKENLGELLPGFMTDIELKHNCAKLNPEKIFKKKIRTSFDQENKLIYDFLLSAVLFDVFIDQRILVDTGLKVFQYYDEIVRTIKSFTHDDILYYTLSVMQANNSLINRDNFVTNQFYELLSHRISFLLIDEFQDTNVNQWNLIRPVISELISGSGIKDYSGFVIVGDEKQAIYGWRGGESKLLSAIEKMFPESENMIITEQLSTSYRSSAAVIDYVNMLFSADTGLSAYMKKACIEWDYPQVNYLDSAQLGYLKVKFESYAKGQKDFLFQRFAAFFHSYWENNAFIREGRTAIIARKNSDLAEIAMLLGNYDIPFQISSSQSIINHQAVKQITNVIKYLAFSNFTDLLVVLRSNAVNMDSSAFYRYCELFRSKAVNSDSQLDFTLQINCLREMDLNYTNLIADFFYHLKKESSLSVKVSRIVDFFGLNQKYTSDNDARALIKFINAVRVYEAANPHYSMQKFLSYIYDNEDETEFKQESTEQKSGVTLLTIHKSKGLEYDSVFLLTQFSGSNPQANSLNFNYWYKYNEDFSEMQNQLLFLNLHGSTIRSAERNNRDGSIINRVSELNIHQRSKELIAEINSLYVGLTRAKTCLFHYIYTLAKDRNSIKVSKSEDYQFKHYLSVIYKLLSESDNYDEEGFEYTTGIIPESDFESSLPVDKKKPELKEFSQYFNLGIQSKTKTFTDSNTADIYSVKQIVERKADVIGSLAHDYLSCIKYNSEDEQKSAESLVLKIYGNVFSLQDLRSLFDQVQKWIKNNEEYFSQVWDKIFNEQTIFDKSGKEFRIDRLMINSAEKTILILDYKTGGISEINQLNNYSEIISSYDYVKDDFKIETRYIKINICL